jgi:hypothetical protein
LNFVSKFKVKCRNQEPMAHVCGKHANDGDPCAGHTHVLQTLEMDAEAASKSIAEAVSKAMQESSSNFSASAEAKAKTKGGAWGGAGSGSASYEAASKQAAENATKSATEAIVSAKAKFDVALTASTACSGHEKAWWEGSIRFTVSVTVSIVVSGTVSKPQVVVTPIVTVIAGVPRGTSGSDDMAYDCMCKRPPHGEPVPTPGGGAKPAEGDPVPTPGGGGKTGSTVIPRSEKTSKVHVQKDFEFATHVTVVDQEPPSTQSDGRAVETAIAAVAIPGASYALIAIVRGGRSSVPDLTTTPTHIEPGTNVMRMPGKLGDGSVVRAVLETPDGTKAVEAATLGSDSTGSYVAADVPSDSTVKELQVLERNGSRDYAIVQRHKALTYTWQLSIQPIREVGQPLGGKLAIQTSPALSGGRFRFTLKAIGPFNPASGSAVVMAATYEIGSIVKVVPLREGEFDVEAAMEVIE